MLRRRDPNWSAIEAVLRDGGIDLDRLCDYTRWERAGWHGEPSLRTLAPRVAAQVLAVQLRDQLGLSWAAAAAEACERLGLDVRTHWRQLARGRARTRRAAARGDDKSVPTLSGAPAIRIPKVAGKR